MRPSRCWPAPNARFDIQARTCTCTHIALLWLCMLMRDVVACVHSVATNLYHIHRHTIARMAHPCMHQRSSQDLSTECKYAHRLTPSRCRRQIMQLSDARCCGVSAERSRHDEANQGFTARSARCQGWWRGQRRQDSASDAPRPPKNQHCLCSVSVLIVLAMFQSPLSLEKVF